MIIHALMIVGEVGIHIKDIISVLMKNNLGNVKQCRTLLKHQKVYINGMIINDIHYIVNENDKIIVDAKEIDSQPFVYYMLNKPKGYLSASSDINSPCVSDIIKQQNCYCIGRLDKDTTGLLLMTNDKTLSKRLLLPQVHKVKVYEVKTKYPILKSLVLRFEEGIIIDKNVKCQSALLKIVEENKCVVTLCEGKYHQIKKMFLSCDNEVVELKRISFAGLMLDSSLKEGEYRALNLQEIEILYK